MATQTSTASRFCLEILGITGLVLQIGCAAMIEKQAARSTYELMERSRSAVQRSADLELARLAAPGGLVQLEAFHLSYPWHRGFTQMLAEASCQYALGFVQWEWELAELDGKREREDLKRRSLASLRRCQNHALAVLGEPRTGDEVSELQTLSKRVAAKSKKSRARDSLATAWYAAAGLARIAVEPMRPTTLELLPKLESLLTVIAEGEPGQARRQAQLVLGAYLCATPTFLGGDPKRGSEILSTVGAREEGGMLMAKVIRARSCSVAARDEQEFDRLLAEVMTAPLEKWPERRLENEMALAKARRYRASAKRWFDAEEVAHDH